MAAARRFRGIGAALLTAMRPDLTGDPETTALMARRLVATGNVSAVLVGGTTGEALTLRPAERAAILQAVVDAVGDAVPVVAGVGAPTLDLSMNIARDALSIGAANVLSPPARGADVRAHYEQMAEVTGDVPLIGYHLPEFYEPIPMELVPYLPIQGLKDSSNDRERLIDELTSFTHIDVYSGSPHLLLELGQRGGAGGIVGMAAILPNLTKRAFDGDADAQRELSAVERNGLWFDGHAPFPQNIKVFAAANGFPELGASTRPMPERN
jgi:4-hydroxy-tetrahydrodipicolinate synthase